MADYLGSFTDTTPKLTWVHNDTEGDPQVAYQVQVDSTPEFNSVSGQPEYDSGVVASATAEHQIGIALSTGVKYVRVRTKDAYNDITSSAWSDIGFFELSTSIQQISDATPTYAFDASTDADNDNIHFELQVDSDPAFGSPVIDVDTEVDQTGWQYDSTGGGSFVAFPAGGLSSTYYGNEVRYAAQPGDELTLETLNDYVWLRVRAKDAVSGAGDWAYYIFNFQSGVVSYTDALVKFRAQGDLFADLAVKFRTYGPVPNVAIKFRTTDEAQVLRDLAVKFRATSALLIHKHVPVKFRALQQPLEDLAVKFRATDTALTFKNLAVKFRALLDIEKIYDAAVKFRTKAVGTTVVFTDFEIQEGAVTGSQNVTLLISATNAAEMAFANDSPSGWSSWVTYQSSYPWTLSGGNGAKKVYLKLRNIDNQETDGDDYAETFLDTSVPNITTLIARTAEDGTSITDSVYQTDDTPWFGWRVPVSPGGIKGYSWALDSDPSDVLNLGQPDMIEDGFDVTPGTGLQVAVAAGEYYFNGERFEEDAKTVSLVVAHPTLSRIDAIYLDGPEGFAAAVQGTAAASPAAPAIPDDGILLAYVTMAAGATTLAGGDISDERPLYVSVDFEKQLIGEGQRQFKVQAITNADTSGGIAVFNLYIAPKNPRVKEVRAYTDSGKTVEILDGERQASENTPYLEWYDPASPGNDTFYYTTDGTDPDIGNGTAITNPFVSLGPLAAGVTLFKVRAILDGLGTKGDISEFRFVYEPDDLTDDIVLIF